MQRRPFGTTGLTVSAIGVGCSRIGGMFSSDSSPKEEAALLDEAIDAGINLFDTSDLYSHGQSEVLVGKAIRHRRDEVVVATKGGYVLPSSSRLVSRIKPLVRPVVRSLGLKRPSPSGGGGPLGAAAQDFSPAHLAAAVEGSLRRLGTDHIDIYQLHSPPRDVVERGEYVDALEGLKRAGKIRHYGIAADHASDVAGVDRLRGVTALEVPFSVIDQDAQREVLPLAGPAGVGVIARSCFGAGLLVGDMPEAALRERTPDWPAIVAFREAAARIGRPRKELALQFSMGAEHVAVTLVGMRAPSQLREILRFVDAPPLDDRERAELTGAAPA